MTRVASGVPKIDEPDDVPASEKEEASEGEQPLKQTVVVEEAEAVSVSGGIAKVPHDTYQEEAKGEQEVNEIDIEENTARIEEIGEFRGAQDVDKEQSETGHQREDTTHGVEQRYNEVVFHF